METKQAVFPSQAIQGHSIWQMRLRRLWKDVKDCRALIIMFLPGLAFFIIFSYIPMSGVVLAFKRWDGNLGIYGSPWVGFKNFENFFASRYSVRIIRNAVILHLLGLAFAFPIPIILAIMLNEVLREYFKRTVQTISYFPYFIAPVVMVGILKMLFGPDPSTGVVNQIITNVLGGQAVNFLAEKGWFRPLYIGMGIWQGSGFGAIIYLAALSAVDVSQYEAAIIDGANRLQLIWHITIPAIIPTIVILLILNLSGLLRAGLETILLMQSPATYETADVIETFVYRRGIAGEGGRPDFAFATAVGLFQSIVGMILLVIANSIARKVGETSLW